ncbi:twin-arginine translocase TatA/TatE family subunit [Microbacterium sp. ABRD28]|uniref:twin-arginine translocase TatA/TatE family subunit n=1 Tax=Microbacterium sp. ABRD28 TaxID=2268461 RepID=UPI000F55697D|nr:twin-arginine translocase TatA/TatE family subunit [Microbacterium sp. ABRD28]AZC13872.1 twin-arginine translocase TatA/TatE family subunit [Microbacterium sp. ABRD28]
MFQNLTGWHFLVVLLVILLLFGAAKLPALAKSVGQSARVFKGEMKAMKDEDAPSGDTTSSTASPTPPAASRDASPGRSSETT